MTDCKHRKLQTWHFADDDQPAGMWSCVACGHKFVPLDIAKEQDAKRYRWLRDVATGGEWETIGQGTDPDSTDAAIDAAMAKETT